jgi:hypothetical protein
MKKDIQAIETEIRKTYSDEQDKETLKWREHLEKVLKKLQSGNKLTEIEKTTVAQCYSNIALSKRLYGNKLKKVI